MEIWGHTTVTQFCDFLARVILKQNLTWNMSVLFLELF